MFRILVETYVVDFTKMFNVYFYSIKSSLSCHHDNFPSVQNTRNTNIKSEKKKQVYVMNQKKKNNFSLGTTLS